MKPLGLLAGNGRFPFLIAQEARKAGRRVIAVAFNEEADPALEQVVDKIYWVFVGQLKKWITIFQDEGVEEVVDIGTGVLSRNLKSRSQNAVHFEFLVSSTTTIPPLIVVFTGIGS
jgi:DUF1009 family protein